MKSKKNYPQNIPNVGWVPSWSLVKRSIFCCTFQFTFLELVLIEALRFATIKGWHSTRYPLIFTTTLDHAYTSRILIAGSGFTVRKLCLF